ncbi:MAG TPA: Stp1/IreP family PP2C-type Ser/Thr phosphatase [Actinomycetota bacterium]|nr:Stp1/IreP family PP2C-type Ser/Thr phosphatase [Actinomycetota bacterium]
MSWTVGAASDVGQIRRANEDSYLVRDPLYVVADGMGGHNAGDVASSTAVAAIAKPEQPTRDDVERLVKEANAAVWEKAQSDRSLQGMGTTVTALFLDGSHGLIAHVGDSRAYLFRQGQLRQLTRDHTLVARMVQEGRISEEEARHHPQRNVITRALGVDADIRVDVESVEFQAGDRVLLCSDGLTSMVEPSVIAETLASEGEPQSAADRLVEAANAAGGEDNITVIVLDLDGASRQSGGSRTPTDPRHHELGPDKARRRYRRVVIPLIVLIALAGLGLGGLRFFLARSWFVAPDQTGTVTIFRGIPEEIAGVSLRTPQKQTDLSVADLPEFLRADVEEARKFDSLAEAEAYVANLSERADEFGVPEEIKNTP